MKAARHIRFLVEERAWKISNANEEADGNDSEYLFIINKITITIMSHDKLCQMLSLRRSVFRIATYKYL